MHRKLLLAVVICSIGVASACGDDDSPTSPSSAPVVLSTILRPANEVPPVGNAESGGVGAVQIALNLTRDAVGTISAATADIYFQASGFPGGTNVIGAHIHPGVAGVNGPIAIGTSLTAVAPLPTDNGTVEYRQTGITVSPADAQALLASPESFYFNIHSPLNPGGFARGQLSRVQ